LAAFVVTLSAGFGVACAGRSSEPTQRPAQAAATAPPATARVPAASSGPSPTESSAVRPTLLISDPQLLQALERQGLSLGGELGATGDARDNQRLSQLPRFAPLVRELEGEAVRAAAGDKLAGVDVARYSHRLFDRRFLRLPAARFVLAGVVNRPDRAAFDASSCGETRLIYRLAYAFDQERASKLPMTLGIELKVPRGSAGCREAAARWLEPSAADAETRANWLRSAVGPLAPALTAVESATARVVVNLQLVRWPSTVRPDMGGHAEYLLRSFRADSAGILRPERLENTVDPNDFRTAVQQKPLLSFLETNAASVDAGTPLLPEAMLATRALSVTPRGLNRLANRPFSVALGAGQVFAARDFSHGAFVKSTAGLLRRLDQLSCQGCHEARSVAGFHLLGEDATDAPAENALAIAVSPQVTADLPRRLRVAEAMLAGVTPDFAAPLAEHATPAGGYGQSCSLAADPSFATWTCPAGLACSAIEANPGDLVGQCLPTTHTVGDACESGGVTPRGDRLRDRVSNVKVEACPLMLCNRSGVGFPGGMCTAGCGAPGSSCGSIAILDSFNACLARGDSFLTCIRGNVTPAGLRSCDAENPCRDDYVCARAAHGGVCLPPYFVFQLRVDGHSSSVR
jgi:hypothetical protein